LSIGFLQVNLISGRLIDAPSKNTILSQNYAQKLAQIIYQQKARTHRPGFLLNLTNLNQIKPA
jgi:hypothetical protein